MCREAVASQDAAAARGWNASVLFLLALVPVVLGALVVAGRRASRRDRGTAEVDGRPRWPTDGER